MEIPLNEYSRLSKTYPTFNDTKGTQYVVVDGVVLQVTMEVTNEQTQAEEAVVAFRLDNPDG